MKEVDRMKFGEIIRARELFRAYQELYEENNKLATSGRMFGLRMKELGMTQKQTVEAGTNRTLRFRAKGLILEQGLLSPYPLLDQIIYKAIRYT